MILPGVKVGPLDPDATADFGQVAAKNSARTLIRTHAALHSQALTGALGRKRQDGRSKALVLSEVQAAAEGVITDAGHEVPEGFIITGAAVRGEDDAPSQQVVSYTYRLPSGREGKGFVPYADLPRSVEEGDESVRIAEAKKAGVPWVPKQAVRALMNGTQEGRDDAEAAVDEDDEAAKEAAAEAERERARLQQEADEAKSAQARAEAKANELRAQLAEAQRVAEQARQQSAAPERPSNEQPPEPWDGYDEMNADAVRARLAGEPEDTRVATAQAVVAFESGPQGKGRSGVISAAQQLIDRPTTG